MSRQAVGDSNRTAGCVIRTLGRYELIEEVGTGGMATVYRGRDTALDREVAVKILHPHLASRAESRARFSREARAVARLSHPSILEIFDYSGDAAPESYLVTEFIHGRTLRAYQSEVGFGFPEIGLLVGRALADALVHAHAAEVIHRDLKPENVLVQEGERCGIRLADFGIARILTSDERLTMTGALVGSPHHMAPEIVEGREADARSDLFSLGTLLYWLATGSLPFAAASPTAILRKLLEGAYEDPRTVDARVSDPLAALLSRLLAVDPMTRPGSAAEVRDALDAILAEVGIDRPAPALDAFLRAPQPYKEGFLSLALPALRARAEEALAAGRDARAVNALDRILVLAPEDADARRQLDRLTRRSRRRRAMVVAAAAAVFLGAAAGLFALREHRRIIPPPVPAAARAAALPGEPEADPPNALRVDPATAGAAAHPSPPAAALRPAPSTLEIHVRPYAQRALLDSVEVAAGVQVVRFQLSPGRSHRIQIEHPCCFPFVRQFTAEEAAQVGELRVPLEPRPARLRVDGPASTRVLVDGRLLGTAGDSQQAPLQLSLPRGESPYEGSVRVELVPPEGPPRAMSIRLKAGAEIVVGAPAEERMP
jgi:tRNA A-37 threonylcarbamoyl transferase component Bud32